MGNNHELWFGYVVKVPSVETITGNHEFTVYWFNKTNKINEFKLNETVADPITVEMILGKVMFMLIVSLFHFTLLNFTKVNSSTEKNAFLN